MPAGVSHLPKRWNLALRVGIVAGLMGVVAAACWSASGLWLDQLPLIRSLGSSAPGSQLTARGFNQALVLMSVLLAIAIGAIGYLFGRKGDQRPRTTNELGLYALGVGYVLAAVLAWVCIPSLMHRSAAEALRRAKDLKPLLQLTKQPPDVTLLTLDQLDSLRHAGDVILSAHFDEGTAPGIVPFARDLGLDGPHLRGFFDELTKMGFYAIMSEPKNYKFSVDPKRIDDYKAKVNDLKSFAATLTSYRTHFSATPECLELFDGAFGRFVEQADKIQVLPDLTLVVDPRISKVLVNQVAGILAIPHQDIAKGTEKALAHWTKPASPDVPAKQADDDPRYVAHVLTDAIEALNQNPVADRLVEQSLVALASRVTQIGKISKEAGRFQAAFRPRFAEVQQALAAAKVPGGSEAHLDVQLALNNLQTRLMDELNSDQPGNGSQVATSTGSGPGQRRLWTVETVYAAWKAKFQWAVYKDVPWPGSSGQTIEQVVMPKMDAKFVEARADGQPQVNPYEFTFEEACKHANAIVVDTLRTYAELLKGVWEANLAEARKDNTPMDPYPKRKVVKAMLRETVKEGEVDSWRKRVKSTGRSETLADTPGGASPDLKKKAVEEVFTWVEDFTSALHGFAEANAEPSQPLKGRLGVWTSYFYYGHGPGKPVVIPFDVFIDAAQTGVGALKPSEMVATMLEPLARNPKPVALASAPVEVKPQTTATAEDPDSRSGAVHPKSNSPKPATKN
jgi:hypothetical protein